MADTGISGSTETPWDDCKVAYGIWNEEISDRFYPDVDGLLPTGWELDETDRTGARCVIVFRVNGIPKEDDGNAVRSLLEKLDREFSETES